MNTSQRGLLRSVTSPPWSSRPKRAESRNLHRQKGYTTRDPGLPLRADRDDVDHAASALFARPRFSANAIAASRTQAPSSCAILARLQALAVARAVTGDDL